MSHSWSPLHLERPLEFYTSRELEYLVLRRTSERIKRKGRPKLFPSLTRHLPIDNSGIRALTLINGGRWLLTVSRFGSVSYYDLDTPGAVERLLIRGQMRNFGGSGDDVVMNVDMDNESALLSFNLALHMERCRGFFLFHHF